MWGYCNSVSVALPGENSDQLSFHENIRISRYSSKSFTVIGKYGNFTLAVHRYVGDLLELSSTSFFGGTKAAWSGRIFTRNKHRIHVHNNTQNLATSASTLENGSRYVFIITSPKYSNCSKEFHILMPSQQSNSSFRNPPLTLYPPSSSRPDLQRGYWYLPGIRMSTCMIHQTKKRGAS